VLDLASHNFKQGILSSWIKQALVFLTWIIGFKGLKNLTTKITILNDLIEHCLSLTKLNKRIKNVFNIYIPPSLSTFGFSLHIPTF